MRSNVTEPGAEDRAGRDTPSQSAVRPSTIPAAMMNPMNAARQNQRMVTWSV
jgi:hypothetical protein